MDSILPNTGMSAVELTRTTTTKLMEEDRWRKVCKGEEDLYKYARKMMWHDFLDLIKSPEYKRTILTDSIDIEQDESLLASLSGAIEVMEAAESAALVRTLQSLFDQDMAAQAYLRLWLIEGMKREEIAHLLGLTKREVTDIRRRVIYKIQLWLSDDDTSGARRN